MLFTVAAFVALGSATASTDDRSSPPPHRWGLVLSGGGARGLAHVGVLRALEEHGLQPDAIAGTSMGAIVGSLRASGMTSDEITKVLKAVNWASILYPRTDAFSWRGQITPRPLIQLVTGKRGPQLPTAALDDAFLNHQLSSLLFESSVAADGDFDNLSIPFRAVATDLATVRPVVLGSGDLAHAVRASMSIPLAFPPVPYGNRLLIDGGLSSDLPVSAAMAMGVDRVIAVDVSQTRRPVDPSAPATSVLVHLIDLLLKRGQSDTTHAGDLWIRLPMPGYGSASYGRLDSLIALGYRGSIGAIGAFADSVGLDRNRRPARSERPDFGPANAVVWHGLSNQTASSARAALGALPRSRFHASDLQPALTRLYRSGLFQSAWPSLRRVGDSTVVAFDVLEEPEHELNLAAAYGNDEGRRVYGRIASRPSSLPFFRLADFTGTYRNDRSAVQLGLERYALGRGGSGVFARAEHVETQTRIFRNAGIVQRPLTVRRGIFAGAQVEVSPGRVAQIAAGWAAIREGQRRWSAPALVLRTEARGAFYRTFDAEWMLGPNAFGRASARVEIGPSFGRLILRPTLHGAFVAGDPPSDALVGLGGPRKLSGIRHGEWLGRRHAALGILLLYPVGVGMSLVGSMEVGTVADAVSATELPDRLQVAGGVGLDVASPLGPLRLHWGMGPQDRTRLDLMFGDRF